MLGNLAISDYIFECSGSFSFSFYKKILAIIYKFSANVFRLFMALDVFVIFGGTRMHFESRTFFFDIMDTHPVSNFFNAFISVMVLFAGTTWGFVGAWIIHWIIFWAPSPF